MKNKDFQLKQIPPNGNLKLSIEEMKVGKTNLKLVYRWIDVILLQKKKSSRANTITHPSAMNSRSSTRSPRNSTSKSDATNIVGKRDRSSALSKAEARSLLKHGTCLTTSESTPEKSRLLVSSVAEALLRTETWQSTWESTKLLQRKATAVQSATRATLKSTT